MWFYRFLWSLKFHGFGLCRTVGFTPHSKLFPTYNTVTHVRQVFRTCARQVNTHADVSFMRNSWSRLGEMDTHNFICLPGKMLKNDLERTWYRISRDVQHLFRWVPLTINTRTRIKPSTNTDGIKETNHLQIEKTSREFYHEGRILFHNSRTKILHLLFQIPSTSPDIDGLPY